VGWDITYHPLGADEIATVYFAGVENPDLVAAFAEKFNVPEFHHENLAAAFARGNDAGMNGPFGKFHGMNMAVVAGHLADTGMCAAAPCLFRRTPPASRDTSAISENLFRKRTRGCSSITG
jgi:hypothetical protein